MPKILNPEPELQSSSVQGSSLRANKSQKEAIEYSDGPLLIVAGAGTGKTTVITEKIAHLIENKFALPEQILALTFTDKASTEMQERVDKLIDIAYADMQISTFHAFCQRILERYGLEVGIPNQFRPLTETDAWLLVRENFAKFDLNYYRPLGNPTKHIYELIDHFQKCKDEMISPQEYLDYAENVKLDKDSVNTDEKSRLTEISNAYHTYNQILLDNNALDFADLIYYTVKLLEDRPNALVAFQKQFKYILVDEFQDVNWSQYKLVQLLTGEKGQLTVVGDDDQSVYAFRGASVANIMRFKDDYKKTKEVVLTENYRSGQEILDIAYKSIKNNNPDRLEQKLNINKKLKSYNLQLKAVVAHLHTPTLEDEVRTVIQEILSLKEKHKSTTWDDFAILVRANSSADPFLQALEKAEIPYEFLASSGLYRQPIVIDCINFFKLLDNYHESISVYRLLLMPFFQISADDLQKFTSMAKRKTISYYEALNRAAEFKLSLDGIEVCQKLNTLINEGMKKARFEKPTAVLYHFLEASGYLAYLAHEECAGNREVIRQIYQLKQFMDYIAKYEEATPHAHVSNFLEHYENVREAGDDGKLYQAVDTPDSVNVMTIHASKGMEFKYVFVVNMVEQRFPSRARGNAIEIPIELVKEQLPEGNIHYQEERRLFYVAMTRAKERLYFTSADNYGGVQKRKLSRFLAELELKSIKLPITNYQLPITGDKKEKKEKLSSKTETPTYPLPTSFSISQIKSYQTCPYQYKLGNVIKLPIKNTHYFTFGNTIHNTLQEFYTRVRQMNSAQQSSLFGLPEKKTKIKGVKVPEEKELLQIYDQKWSGDWFLSKKQREDYYRDGKDILKAFYSANYNNWTVPIALESGFKIKIGGYLIAGRIDRVDQLPDGSLEIIDYKTGQIKEKVTGDDKDQLLLYQIVGELVPEYHNIGKVGKLTFYYVNGGIRTEFFGEEKELEKLKTKIKNVLDKIHDRDFTATPNKHICKNCSFRDICEFRV